MSEPFFLVPVDEFQSRARRGWSDKRLQQAYATYLRSFDSPAWLCLTKHTREAFEADAQAILKEINRRYEAKGQP